MTKLGAVVASLAVAAGTTAVLAAGPAQAATATTTKLDISSKTHVSGKYGDFVGLLSGTVTDSNGDVSDGTVQLQAKVPGKGWKTVKSDTDPGFFSFGEYGSKAKGNVQYRAHYLGNTTDSASYSNVVSVTTYWNLHETGGCVGRSCTFHGKLGPKAKHHKVTVQVRSGKHWKKYKVVKTDKHSKWKAHVAAARGKGRLYRAVVGGTKHEHKTTSSVWKFTIF